MANEQKHDQHEPKKDDHGAVAVAPPPPEPPKPFPDGPKVAYSVVESLPPRLVYNQEELDALDPARWTTIPPQKAKDPKPEYPQLWYNVNSVPKLVNSADEAAALGPDYRQFHLPKPAPAK